ncbi:ABC transporter substrate-binding protein [Sphingomonas lacunae]|uniref:ABC transporter substrate-binding protein n=1 Tax=Sphingomonas lacunae TaxID=2698828 RepID=A0A6M4AX10_9SPHN|nr:ABC transporter substrate-binding protein [Sphingomonas lacunae]QJQ32920.1 ABC transporter substrate-binding protein [Sphingomonas lacunae]
MKRSLYLALYLAPAVTLASCHPAAPPPTPPVAAGTGPATPSGDRIVSLDYCADQMLLGLVERHRIAAVSPEVASDPLFSEPLSRGLPRVRPDVERVLAMRPTLVIRSYGGGPRIEAALRRAGVPVFTLPYADDIPAIRRSITASGGVLGTPDVAARRVAHLDAAIAAAETARPMALTALYVTPGNVTTGPDSLVGRLIATAGLSSYELRPGWHRLPIERLAGHPPDLVVRGFYDSPMHQQDRWSSSSHRVLRASIAAVPQVSIPGSEIACGNWLAGNALRRLVGARQVLRQ